MPDPVLHLIVGPNGSGKSTLHAEVVGPVTGLPFVNADHLAATHWPDDPVSRSYDAAVLAADRRRALIERRASFAAETVFSHESKLEVVRAARSAGYLVTVHVVLVPEALAVARVANRVASGGHAVPEPKVRARYHRLWPLVAEAIAQADHSIAYDNARAARPFRIVATFDRGRPLGPPDWPPWAPPPLRAIGHPSVDVAHPPFAR